MALVDMTGQKFGRWTVLSLDETSTKPKYWFCVCECGTKRRVIGFTLRRGQSVSCGCYASEWSVKKHTRHGMYRHAAYSTWRAMHQRCTVPKNPGYPEYGARGIKICEKWQTFEGFWEDMGPTWKEGLSIDRMENNGHYERNNCRWATAMEQGNNRRNNQMIPTPHGPMTVSDASRQFGINRNTIFRRIRDGWPRERLIEAAQYHPRWHTTQET